MYHRTKYWQTASEANGHFIFTCLLKGLQGVVRGQLYLEPVCRAMKLLGGLCHRRSMFSGSRMEIPLNMCSGDKHLFNAVMLALQACCAFAMVSTQDSSGQTFDSS